MDTSGDVEAAVAVAETATAPSTLSSPSEKANAPLLSPIEFSMSSAVVAPSHEVSDTVVDIIAVADQRILNNMNPLSPRLQPIKDAGATSANGTRDIKLPKVANASQQPGLSVKVNNASSKRRNTVESIVSIKNHQSRPISANKRNNQENQLGSHGTSSMLGAITDAASDAFSKIGNAMDTLIKQQPPKQSTRATNAVRRNSLDGNSSKINGTSSKSDRDRISVSKKGEAATTATTSNRNPSGRRSAERKPVSMEAAKVGHQEIARELAAQLARELGIATDDDNGKATTTATQDSDATNEDIDEDPSCMSLKRQKSTEVPDTMIYLSSLA
jgi:hypothetical protein